MADFVDVAVIEVQSGRGGDGAVCFRREKYVPRGGPNGGDGGHGGSVILRVDPHMRTLLDFTYTTRFKAPDGAPGGSNGKTGASGQDLIIRVPPGTVVYNDETGELVADLMGPGYELVAAVGGRGGRGNQHFARPWRQAPHFAERGEPGQRYRLRLELKLLADVGIIGFPNVGKSTLIAHISAARPKIAPYPFTTLTPNLGVVSLDKERQFVVADLPGLIENAHAGTGLGHQFLRHVERARMLWHVLDVSGWEGRDPLQDFAIINRELALYKVQLAALPQLVVLNKIDLPEARERAMQYQQELETQGFKTLAISAATGEGLPQLLTQTWTMLQEMGGPAALAPEAAAEKVVLHMPPEPYRELRVEKLQEGLYLVSGTAVEKMMARADLAHGEGVARAQKILEKMGVLEKLERLGIQGGDVVIIGDVEMEYWPDAMPPWEEEK